MGIILQGLGTGLLVTQGYGTTPLIVYPNPFAGSANYKSDDALAGTADYKGGQTS